ncbi:class I SAM-dependent methyltransferase [Rhodococcus sp. WS1]|uniref:TylF/MycF/NovP-related O-methyltransferase n=1 Tax=unclassified Rhodococcus (in: high G+C Gram-positive bacteria) TaxID=192944 RepID=UPI001144AD46|nr:MULTISPECIES: class I SAM-dependent methyltransferase [unclassified Rhodococcus (in: high G+C Gram-positive bacteria)]ROZ54939.1 class I SAM-dependent methyltransferase [Rhodococcus sp. WS1]TQC38076.1 class I SAM-dependent methyltransferase [Rhodococcus sp. WS7]
MFEQFRSSARTKLQRAVSEVVEAADRRNADRTQQILDALALSRDELAEARGDIAGLRSRIDELEFRQRRDLAYAVDLQATASTAEFILEHLRVAETFAHPHDTLRHALGLIEIPGMALEFGVASGTTLRIVAEAFPEREGTVAGFDVFSGLPETWRTGFPVGEFAQESIPEVPGAQLVPGLFEDTLPSFLNDESGPVAFLHLDADLYSSTKTVLDLLGDRLVPGSIVVFDEFFNYPGWQQHEYRAWTEFVTRTGISFEYLGYTVDNEQVIAKIVR